MIRAVVFDFDGVIANSEPLHFRAYRDILGERGVTLSETDYYGRYLGYDDAGAFTAIAADRGLDWNGQEIARLVSAKAIRLEDLERDRSVLFPGAAEAVRRLAAACPLAIASGALRAEILRVLEREGLTDHFHAVVGAEDTAAGKPAPDPYLKAVDLLATATTGPFAASECVAIEDSQWGLQSARAAGLRTIAVTHTYSADHLTADRIVSHLDVLSWEFLETL